MYYIFYNCTYTFHRSLVNISSPEPIGYFLFSQFYLYFYSYLMYFHSLNFWESVYPIFLTSCTASLFCGLPLYFGYLLYSVKCTVYCRSKPYKLPILKSVLWIRIGNKFLAWSDPGFGSETGYDFFGIITCSVFIIFGSKYSETSLASAVFIHSLYFNFLGLYLRVSSESGIN
jgi:hypothetical protein